MARPLLRASRTRRHGCRRALVGLLSVALLSVALLASCAGDTPDADTSDAVGTVDAAGLANAADVIDVTGTGADRSVAPHDSMTAVERIRAGRSRPLPMPTGGDTEAGATGAAVAIRTVADPVAADDTGAGDAADDSVAFDWRTPAWLPPPPVPADNPMSDAKVRLGRHLFHDRRLSADDSVACASCHEQSLGFTDGRPLAVGIHGTEARRNAMGLANVGYLPVLTWSNPHMSSLERQSLVPLFGEEPLEMGLGGREDALFERLATDPDYAAMFREAFPDHDGAVTLATVTRALAAFQRTLISVGSAYDRYKYGGEADALDAAALRGEMLFFSETAECYHCHQGFNFTDTLQTSRSAFPEIAFHNTGLYDIDGRGSYPPGQQGLRELSGRDADMGRFRTPSLRNVSVTAPYFHDGSAATLDDVLDHYAAGGRTLDGPHAGNGRNNPLKDSLVKGFTLEGTMREDLKAFLHSLTDEAFLTDARFADPWPEDHPARGRTAPSPDIPSASPSSSPDSDKDRLHP